MGRKEMVIMATLCVAIVAVAVLAMMPSQSHSLLYDSNSDACSGSTEDAGSYASGDSAEVMDCGFQRPGFTFLCWNTSPDGSGMSYHPGDKLSLDGDVMLYARWLRGAFSLSGDVLSVEEVPGTVGGRHLIDVSGFPAFKTLEIPAVTAEAMSGSPVDVRLPGGVRAGFGAGTFAAMASAAVTAGEPLSLTVEDCPTDMTDAQESAVGDSDVYRIAIDAGAKVEWFDGEAEFVLPHEFSGAETAEVWCVFGDGTAEVMRTEVGDGSVSFKTPHLSLFAVLDMVPVSCSVRPAEGQDIPAEVLAAFSASVSFTNRPAVQDAGMARVGERVTAEVHGSCAGYACALRLDGASQSSDGHVVTGPSLDAVAVVSRAAGGHSVTAVQPATGGTISVQGTASAGSFVPVTAVPERGQVLKSLSVSCADKSQTVRPTLTGFTMPSCSVEVTATFGPGSGMHAVLLPAETRMYKVTASETSVEDGGSLRLQLTVSLGYVKNESFAFKVNGSVVDLDSLDRCTVSSVRSDQTVTVEGIENAVSHKVTVPSDQKGYVLSADRERVPEEESYTLSFSIVDGYRKGVGFSVSVNGSPVDVSSGTCSVSNVLASQKITVEGVELIPYRVSAGANTSVLCGGAPVSTATVMDVLSVVPAEGYELPASYATAAGAIDTVTATGSGYKVSGDTVFPSIWSVTAGENTSVSSRFVVSGGSVTVSADTGYEIPSDYFDSIRLMVDMSNVDSIVVNRNVSLPAVYLVIYEIDNNISSITSKCYTGGIQFDQPIDPTKQHYLFSKWVDENKESFFVDRKSPVITNDVRLLAEWTPERYTLSFGTNINLIVNGNIYTHAESPIYVTVEDVISFDPELSKPNDYDFHLRDQNVSIDGGIYTIKQNTEFKGIVKVNYIFPNVEDTNVQYVIVGTPFVPLSPAKLSIVVPEYKMFNGWYLNDDYSTVFASSAILSTESDITLRACMSYRIEYDNIVLSERNGEYQITIGSHSEAIDGNRLMITGSTTMNSITINKNYSCWREYTLELHDVSIEWSEENIGNPIMDKSSIFDVIATGTTTITVDGVAIDIGAI